MPQFHTYSQKLGRWIKKKTERAFDYDFIDEKSAGLLISFFRWYPDYFLDIIRSPNASYKLELPQRLMLRAAARYRNTYITGARGLTKTYIIILSKMLDGVFFPGEIIRYTAPNQKQAATLASQAFKQIEIDYPILAKCWKVVNNRGDLFKITTDYGSEFSMYTPRGDTCSQTVAEEIGQEGEYPFDMEEYEQKILPTCRKTRAVNQKIDPTHINQKHAHISNACSRINPAYTQHRAIVMALMVKGKPYEGFVMDMPWEVALLCNIRDIEYISDMKMRLSAENWLREMCAIYIGTNENPIVTDEALSRCRKLKVMEESHCGDPNAIYIIAHDVSYEDGARNAKCADAVLKLTRFTSELKRDKYRKQLVYCDAYPPPATQFLQAAHLKDLWRKYSLDGGQATYIVVDAWQYGKGVVEELLKPSNDGLPPLCCYNHMAMTELEQDGALPVIYPLKAGTRGTADEEGSMLRYAQTEFEQDNVELLTSNIFTGIEQYKLLHNIKDNNTDRQISYPYSKTEELCQQIENLTLTVSGTTLKEKRKSKSIQRDMWSAMKYALRVANLLEAELAKENYRQKNSWTQEIERVMQGRINYPHGGGLGGSMGSNSGERARLLGLRKR